MNSVTAFHLTASVTVLKPDFKELPQSAVPATNPALRGSQSAVPATNSALQGRQSTAPATKSASHSLHLSRSQSESKITLPCLPRNLHLEVKPLRSLAPATKSQTVDHENTRFPLRLPRKVTTMSENAHGTTTRAQSRQAPAPATQILRACAAEMRLEDFERHECAVNSSELAGHGRAVTSI